MHAVAVTSDGYSLRFGLEPFVEVSTRAGRRFARVGQGAEVVGVSIVKGGEMLIAATRQARALLCKVDEVNFLSGPGRGVILIKVAKDEDRVLGFIASSGDRDLLTVETTRGAAQTISTAKYSLTSRGGRGRELLQRGEFTRVLPQLPELPVLGRARKAELDPTFRFTRRLSAGFDEACAIGAPESFAIASLIVAQRADLRRVPGVGPLELALAFEIPSLPARVVFAARRAAFLDAAVVAGAPGGASVRLSCGSSATLSNSKRLSRLSRFVSNRSNSTAAIRDSERVSHPSRLASNVLNCAGEYR